MPAPVVWRLDTAGVLALAAFGVALGGWLKRRLPVLDRLHIPGPIAGGLVYALAALALHHRGISIEADAGIRDLLQIAFFTTIGMSASMGAIRAGGAQVGIMLGVATLGAVLQNALGMAAARLFGLHPLLGVVSGSMALAGGPATTLAFGPAFEKLGVEGATAVGLASATFGITAAGLIGGYVGGRLIRSRGLAPARTAPSAVRDRTAAVAGGGIAGLTGNVIAVAVAMGIGGLIGAAFARSGVILPAYIGAMLVAALMRNLDERFGFLRISPASMAAIGDVSLQLFIVTAMLALRLWDLASLAVPLLVMLALQVVLACLMAAALSFRAMGRDYESAVMAGGFCGFMLGITANAVACMDELERKFGPAPRAFLVVPLVGAFLIDFTNALLLTLAMNLAR